MDENPLHSQGQVVLIKEEHAAKLNVFTRIVEYELHNYEYMKL